MKNLKNYFKPVSIGGAVVEVLRRWKFLLLLVVVLTIVYSSLSIFRHKHFISSAYDLGIFDQIIWHYSRFEIPYTSIRSNLPRENILGDHFHPILMVLAPLYWITDRVEALLIAQALLFAIAVIPIFLFTEKRLGRAAGYLFAISYSIYWGVQLAVEFDFHEIAFAVPLIAFMIYFSDQQRWRACFACVGLLLLTKEDLSLVVACFGLYLVTRKEMRKGLITLAVGVLWFFLAIKVLIPFFSGEHGDGFHYWSYKSFGEGPGSAIITILKNPLMVVRTLFSPSVKINTWLYIFYPFLFLALFSPLILLALPLLAARFLSDQSHFWQVAFHYTGAVAPIVVMASADGLARVAGLTRTIRARRVVVLSASSLVLALNLYLLPQFPLWNLTSYSYRHRTASDRIGYEALSQIPPDASVAAQANIVPHLSHRQRLFLIRPHFFIPETQYVIASNQIGPYPFETFDGIAAFLAERQARGYSKIYERDGWIVLKRDRPPRPSPPYELKDCADIQRIVYSIYTQVLGREPDEAGGRIWRDHTRMNRASTRGVVKQFAESDEFAIIAGQQGSAEASVTLIYKRLLARDPSPEETVKGAEMIKAGRLKELISGLLYGPEYETKFGECRVPGAQPVTDCDCLLLGE